jgi:hypothetical protein
LGILIGKLEIPVFKTGSMTGNAQISAGMI